MRCVRSRGTNLETRLAALMKKHGVRYRSQPAIYGHPDFRLLYGRVAVFCDSDFWHGRRCVETSGRAFRRNRQLWVEKLTSTARRDAKVSRELRCRGWSVWRFRERDILKRPEWVAARLRLAVSQNHG